MSAEILHFHRMDDAPNRIRELRLAAGKSQQWLGTHVGVSKVTISDLERGNMRLDTDYMRRIAAALGVAPADLLSRHDNADALTAQERQLIDQLRASPPDAREQVYRVADVIAPWRGAKRETG